MNAHQPFSADVVVDVSNVAHGVADLWEEYGLEVDGNRIEPHSEAIRDVLAAHHIEARSIYMVVPAEVVGVEAPSRWVIETINRTRKWAEGQAATDNDVHIVRGGLSDQGEVGVDSLAVVVALDLLHRSPDDEPTLVLVSDDSDLAVAGDLIDRGRLVLAGNFHEGTTARYRRSGLDHLVLGGAWFARLGPSTRGLRHPPEITPRPAGVCDHDSVEGLPGDAIVLARGGPKPHAVSTPIDRLWGRRAQTTRLRPLPDMGAAALLDPYGLALERQRLGDSSHHLPTANTVRALASELGYPGPVAVWATIPDLWDRAARRLDDEGERFWRERDEALDAASRELRDDDDLSTWVERGRLLPRTGDDNSESRATQKAVSTRMAADLHLLARVAPDLPILLLTDRPELVLVCDFLIDEGIVAADHIRRVGLVNDPVGAHRTATRVLTTVLTPDQARSLFGEG
ncbi:MAG: hypothetical protein GY698_09460 [Actinomycetia bacterium]|nr:hypothetical protein [Actinomycetes bacterium]